MNASTDNAQPSQRQTLGLKFAESRAPETPILNAEGLTKAEALSLVDLARYWARIGKTEYSYQEDPSTWECLPTFLNAVFADWDSTHGAPTVPRTMPRSQKEDKGLVIGRWGEDIAPSRTEVASAKRKQTDSAEEPPAKKPPTKKPSFRRKRGENAWLTLILDDMGGYQYQFLDDNARMVPGKTPVVYNPGMTFTKARARCVSIYDQAEKTRVNDFNKRLLLATARRYITKFVDSGNPGDDEGLLEMAREVDIEERFVVLRLAHEVLNRERDVLDESLSMIGHGSS
ncbi:hypothetical protein CEP54_002461 [Fusarium duplospermum]|uniref:Uncharacterized protein n=1 Tax=Fusarium duplospermum TaxID=1325734 RepID=A0A428QV09_9HYPO|nr:hypothetical protein CEP54_002461 [Fusarium duplospermum]